MARLIGELPDNAAERFIYEFIMNELPDYIYAGFDLEIPSGPLSRRWNCDFLMIVPHMGVFIMEVKSFRSMYFQNGELYTQNSFGQNRQVSLHALQQYRYSVKKYLKERFDIAPYVSEMLCLPFVEGNAVISDRMSGMVNPDFIFFAEAFKDRYSFMSVLQKGKYSNELWYHDIAGKGFDDISDSKAHDIFYNWENDNELRGRISQFPKVFFCYGETDGNYAAEIREDLEYRGLDVISDPERFPDCGAFLFLLSSRSQEDPAIRELFEKAKKEEKRIIPLVIEDCDINDYYKAALTHFQYRVMVKPDYQIMSEIENVIKKRETL